MADEPNTPDPTPPNPDEVDLEELIGGVLEARGFTADRAAKLDILDSLGESFGGIGGKFDELFTKLTPGTPAKEGESSGFDMDALLSKVGELVDAKMAGLAPGTPAPTEKKKPLMQRMLGVS